MHYLLPKRLVIERSITKNLLKLIVASVILTTINSCITTYDTVSNRNFSSKYNPEKQQLHPKYKIYKKSDNEYRLYFRFFPFEFASVLLNEDTLPKSYAQLFFRTTKDYSSIKILDSLSTNFVFKGKTHHQFTGFVPIKFPSEGTYTLEVFLIDKIAKTSSSTVIDVEVSNSQNPNSYMMLTQNGSTIFKNYFTINDSLRIRSDIHNKDGLNISYYKPNNTIPKPPDIPDKIYLDPPPKDSTIICPFPDTTILTFNKYGIYNFCGKNQLIGKTYLCVDEHFPQIKTPQKMLQTIQYICSKKEFNSLQAMKSAKAAVDTFWLSLTNDVDKSRELIRIYYNRVQLANYFFTDYKEGWLSDRGMIYIMFGAPANVQKSELGEKWIYGKGATDEMIFYFYKDKHPIFDNTYILDRSDLYTRVWFNAIATWREGRVFSLNL